MFTYDSRLPLAAIITTNAVMRQEGKNNFTKSETPKILRELPTVVPEVGLNLD